MTKVYSMTGFGRADGEAAGVKVAVEAKSVNHRYLDLHSRLPRELLAIEQKVTELARKHFCRGRIDLWVYFGPGERPVEVVWNRTLAREIARALREMRDELGLTGEPDLSLLASQKDVILCVDASQSQEEWTPEWEALFTECFNRLNDMRGREGKLLAADIKERLVALRARVERMEELAPSVTVRYREKLAARVTELLEGERAEPERMAQEVALFADKADITEELVRMKAHLERFDEVLDSEGPKGRKLDFLVQEMFREMTTSSNKAQESELNAICVDVKAELEKVREQVQNLE